MSTTPFSTFIACGVSAVIAGTAGWALRGPAAMQRDEARRAIEARPPQPGAEMPRDTAPLIAVLRDGNVTLHVERRPLEWVLQEIAVQRRRLKSNYNARPGAPVAVAAAHTTCTEPPVDAARLLQTIAHGSDAERFDGLMQARHASVFVPDDVLKMLYETDPSEQVRLAAFGVYLERHGGESVTVRKALEAALVVPSAAIQQEARQRLAELAEREALDAASSQGTQP